MKSVTLVFIKFILNKTAATTGIFCVLPFFFKTFLISKKHSCVVMFQFSNFKTFVIFLPKNFIIRAEKTLLRNHTILCAFDSNLTPLAILKRFMFFSKKPTTFSKKNPSFERFEKSYCFSRILQQNCYNLARKITFRIVNEHRECNWGTSC